MSGARVGSASVALFALSFAATSTAASVASAYCPSYGTAAGCAVEPALGKNPDVATFRSLFDKIGTASFTSAEGPSLSPLASGCEKPNPETTTPARFPCHVLYAIAQQESDWKQFCVPESPQSAVGKPERTIVSFDCGYGVSQVTSGMREGESPDFDQKRVASDTLYNMAAGAGILRQKWQASECVGDRDPDVVEHWYSALWAYNGNAYSNNPNNPTHSPGRNVYDPENGGSYPYQEKVLGWMEFPKGGRWESILPAYPNRAEIGSGSKARELSEPQCATPTDCVWKRTRNLSACTPPPTPVPDGGPEPIPQPGLDGGANEDDGGAEVPATPPPPPEEGCACGAAGRGRGVGAHGLVAGLAFALFSLARRRRS